MNDQSRYVINTEALFDALNGKRRNIGLIEIDNPLISSKLGILFALKTNGYINFKGEFIELNDTQLIALQNIFNQHFNAEMSHEIRSLVTTQESPPSKQAARYHRHSLSSTAANRSIFHKIKGFLRTKPKMQEEPA